MTKRNERIDLINNATTVLDRGKEFRINRHCEALFKHCISEIVELNYSVKVDPSNPENLVFYIAGEPWQIAELYNKFEIALLEGLT